VPSRDFRRRADGLLRWRAPIWAAACLASCCPTLAATEPVDFAREIQPLLAKRCFACHGPETQEAGLRLDGEAASRAVLDSQAQAVVPGDAAASGMLARITAEDPDTRMPPEGPRLTAAQVETIRRWIEAGAEYRDHWAFRPVTRPTPPAAPAATGPIDAFIRQGLDRRDLPVPAPADRRALLRRATYGVTGLPPTERDMDEFLADGSAEAWEKVVDRLLASPHYGEHWARHWLDIVRYADTNSFERDGDKPHAWRYRDYVIRSLNDDKPYDRFVIEQLAGDELPGPGADDLIATGYYRIGVWDDEPADALQARYDWLDDIVSTTGQAFLGLTVGCGRCHDHKIDPFTQRDYYSLLAFVHNVTPMGERQMNLAAIERPLPTAEESAGDLEHRVEQLRRQREQVDDEIKAIERRIKEHGDQAFDDLTRRDLATLKKQRRELDAEQGRIDKALVVSEHGAVAPETFVLPRGNPRAEPRTADRVEPAFPAVFRAAPPVVMPTADGRSSGRRLALARWIASAENPLTARVLVNRIWQHHFGRGIVRSSSNFGLMGDPPTHPELLDWLASELVAAGWRLKPLHKAILMSAAYRASSAGSAAGLALDPLNDSFWRFDMRRLAAEELRDSIHVVSGEFDPRMFGPGVYPAIPQAVLAGQSRPGHGWGSSPPEEQARRSIYAHVKRSLVTPILADFDTADTDTPCPVRFVTTQPTQALGMMNGEFLQRQAKVFADRVRREVLPGHPAPDADADTAALVRRAFELAVLRPAAADEVARGVALVDHLEAADGVAPSRAFELYCLMVLNLNEFCYLD